MRVKLGGASEGLDNVKLGCRYGSSEGFVTIVLISLQLAGLLLLLLLVLVMEGASRDGAMALGTAPARHAVSTILCLAAVSFSLIATCASFTRRRSKSVSRWRARRSVSPSCASKARTSLNQGYDRVELLC